MRLKRIPASAAATAVLVGAPAGAFAREPARKKVTKKCAPGWSPDGKWIVFSRRSSLDDNDQEIYVMKADGSGITNITKNPAGDAAPKWFGVAPS